MKLREFKARQIARLMELKKQMLITHVNKADRVEYVVNTLIAKLQKLRTYTINSYLLTIHAFAKEFPELEELIPDHATIERLMREAE